MDYYDDLLNVYGYLRYKSKRTAANLDVAIQYEKCIEEQLAASDARLDRVSQMLRDVAKRYDIAVEPERRVNEPPLVEKYAFKRIKLPSDIDYEQEYQKLVTEARACGFTNVHLEELLTVEEMAFAEDYSKKLDLQFAEATGLTSWDMFVVGIGVCLHLLRIYLPKSVIPSRSSKAWEQMPNRTGQGDESGTLQELLEIARELNNIIPNKNYLNLKAPSQILADKPVFQCFSDKRYPDKGSVLGYDPMLGWLFGVYNLMTDTVTFSDLRTFLSEPDAGEDILKLSRDYLPMRDVLAPFATGSLDGKRDQLVAAVIREAYVLIPQQIDFASMAEHYDYSKRLLSIAMQGAGTLSQVLPVDRIDQILPQAGWASVINAILIALHGLGRDREIDVKCYMVRSMKVVTIASFISSIVGSLHVIVDQDYLGADWGGLATSLIECLHMTRFWINVKAEFLKSAYLPKLKEQLSDLDQYFEN